MAWSLFRRGRQQIAARKVAAQRWRSGESEARTARYDKSEVRSTKGGPEAPTGMRLHE